MEWLFLSRCRFWGVSCLASAVVLIGFLHATTSATASGQASDFSCVSQITVAPARTGKLVSVGPAGTLTFEGLDGRFRLAGVGGLRSAGAASALRPGRSYVVHAAGEADRYGRQAAYLVGDGTAWVQADLLSRGLALVQSDEGISADCLAALRAAERLGEANKQGYWADSSLVLAADDPSALREKQGQFVLVKGKVLSVGDRKRRVYLNFGQKWSQDFTVSLAKSGRGAFKGDLTRLLSAKGATLRVRGVLEWSGGPLIRVLDEGQLELALP